MRIAFFACSVVTIAAAACSGAPGNQRSGGSGASGNGASGNGASGNGASGTGTDTGLGGGFTTGTGNGPPGCSAAAELVYVLATDNTLWSFQPDKKIFTLIGSLGCHPPDGATPNSMAVDRNAVAWVNYVASDGLGADTGGWVYQVSTSDASCAAQPTFTISDASWHRLGMGFSTDAAGGTSETLFVAGTGTVGAANSPGLGKLDFPTKSLVPIHQFAGDAQLTSQSAELTGTGDARLFGFFTTHPVRVAQIDKPGAAILSDMPVSSVPTPRAWAFSFWGGAFYLYTSNGSTNSTVTRFDPTTKAVDASYQLTAPMIIDGAGVSTCAPVGPTT
jgi:hypothetical protein